MAHLSIELILWLLLVFFIGCIIGYLLRWLLSVEPAARSTTAAATATGAASQASDSTPVAARATQPEAKAKPIAVTPPTGAGTPIKAKPVPAMPPAELKAAPVAPRTAQPSGMIEPKPVAPRPTAEPRPLAKPLPVASSAATAKPTGAARSKTETTKTATTRTSAAKPKRPRATGKPKRPRGMAKARRGKADNLQQISGVGPKLEKTLQGLGFFHFNQIADWNSDEVMWVDEHLRFKGRITRDEWIPQAKLLAAGNLNKFAKLYGTGGMKNSKGETKSGSRTRRSK